MAAGGADDLTGGEGGTGLGDDIFEIEAELGGHGGGGDVADVGLFGIGIDDDDGACAGRGRGVDAGGGEGWAFEDAAADGIGGGGDVDGGLIGTGPGAGCGEIGGKLDGVADAERKAAAGVEGIAAEGIVGDFVDEGDGIGMAQEIVPQEIGGAGEEDNRAVANIFFDDGGLARSAVGAVVAEDDIGGFIVGGGELEVLFGLDAIEADAGIVVGVGAEFLERGVDVILEGEGEAVVVFLGNADDSGEEFIAGGAVTEGIFQGIDIGVWAGEIDQEAAVGDEFLECVGHVFVGGGGVGEDDDVVIGERSFGQVAGGDGGGGEHGGGFAIDGGTVGGPDQGGGIDAAGIGGEAAIDEEDGDFAADVDDEAADVVDGEEVGSAQAGLEQVAAGGGEFDIADAGGDGGAAFDFGDLDGLNDDAIGGERHGDVEGGLVVAVKDGDLEIGGIVGDDGGTEGADIGDGVIGLGIDADVDGGNGGQFLDGGDGGFEVIAGEAQRVADGGGFGAHGAMIGIADGTVGKIGDEEDLAGWGVELEFLEQFRGLVEGIGETGAAIGEDGGVDLGFDSGVIVGGFSNGIGGGDARGADQRDAVGIVERGEM